MISKYVSLGFVRLVFEKKCYLRLPDANVNVKNESKFKDYDKNYANVKVYFD